MSIFQQLERYVPAEYLDDWRRWVAYTAKYQPTDEIAHICQAAGWLALLTRETPNDFSLHAGRFLETLSAKLGVEQAQRSDLQRAIIILTETLQDEVGNLSKSTRASNNEITTALNENITQLRSEIEKLKTTRMVTWAGTLFLTWAFGILTYAFLSLVFH